LGIGDHATPGGQEAAQLRWNCGPSSARWRGQPTFGASAG